MMALSAYTDLVLSLSKDGPSLQRRGSTGSPLGMQFEYSQEFPHA